MKPLRGFILCGALAALFCTADTASAAWNNVFQVTLFHRNKPAVANYYAVPVPVAPAPTAVYSSPVVAYSNPCDPCPKPVCSTSYVQRCYYQPVTTYQTKTYYEPVTTMQTSYYYEAVTSVRYSCYYDPCTCSYQQVAVPTTSYCLKAKQCPVQSWVQKCCQVPVTSYQKCCYWQPQTTCCQPVNPCPPNPCPPAAPAVPAPVGVPAGPPPVQDFKVPGAMPNGPVQQDKYYGPPVNEGSQMKSYSPPALGSPIPAGYPQDQPQLPKTPIKLDKFASLSGGNAIKGQVVTYSNAPRPNTQVVFVNATMKGATPKAVTANSSGQFNVALTSGQWHVYIQDGDGHKTYHSKIQNSDEQPSYLTLVSKKRVVGGQ
jgi:hypothetical protein